MIKKNVVILTDFIKIKIQTFIKIDIILFFFVLNCRKNIMSNAILHFQTF